MNEPDPNIAAFLRVLSPADNATGGGTASAVAGAMAAALAAMVARLSIGKPGLGADDYYRRIDAEGCALAVLLLEGGREDAEAFDALRRTYRMPKETDEQKTARSQAIQRELENATRIPLANAERCHQALSLCDKLRDRSNPNAASDLMAAFYLAHAGLRGCLANVEINAASLKDAQVKAEISTRAQALGQVSPPTL